MRSYLAPLRSQDDLSCRTMTYLFAFSLHRVLGRVTQTVLEWSTFWLLTCRGYHVNLHGERKGAAWQKIFILPSVPHGPSEKSTGFSKRHPLSNLFTFNECLKVLLGLERELVILSWGWLYHCDRIYKQIVDLGMALVLHQFLLSLGFTGTIWIILTIIT